MKKSIFISLFLCLMLISQKAYATLNVPATIQTIMEHKTEIMNKIEEYQKKIQDIQTRIKEGFDAVSNCIKNPMKCDMGKLQGFIVDNPVKRITKIPAMPDSAFATDSTFYKVDQSSLIDSTRTTYIYKRGKDSMQNLRKNRDNLNNVISDEDAQLFAKGATTLHMILAENDEDLYNCPEVDANDEGSMSKILARHSELSLVTANRLARLLELRAGMISAESTAGLKQQSQEDQ